MIHKLCWNSVNIVYLVNHMLVNRVGFMFEDTCSQIQTTQILLCFFLQWALDWEFQLKKWNPPKLELNKNWLNSSILMVDGQTQSLISASWINEYAILWSWLYKNNSQILVCTKWFWHVFFPNMNLQYFTCKCTWISTE